MRWRSPQRTSAVVLCLCALAGCQNPQRQLSLYAPFGPAAVPPPSLTRVNGAPYYSPPADGKTPAADDKTAPGTTASTTDNKLSHYDPYRGVLLPGGFAPSPVALRSSETDADAARASELASTARSRPSTEEPIRIVEPAPKGLGSAIESTIARATEGRSSGAVQFNASPPSGAIRNITAVPATINAAPAAEVARLPKTTAPAPIVSPPALMAPPNLSPPPASTNPPAGGVIPATPAEPRKLSLWNDPADGSRVEPVSYSGAVRFNSSSSDAGGSWRQRSQ